jgi:hypothetical protein
MLSVVTLVFTYKFHLTKNLAVVADGATEEVRFHTTYSHEELATSHSSWVEEPRQSENDPFDFSIYMDKVYSFRLILWRTDTQIDIGAINDSVQLAFGAPSPILRKAWRPLCHSDGH